MGETVPNYSELLSPEACRALDQAREELNGLREQHKSYAAFGEACRYLAGAFQHWPVPAIGVMADAIELKWPDLCLYLFGEGEPVVLIRCGEKFKLSDLSSTLLNSHR
jgi:hypothetical protein